EPGEERLEHSRRRRESVQQEKRRRVFRTGLSIKDGEPIYLYRPIKNRVFHGTFLSFGEQLKRCEHHRNHQHCAAGLQAPEGTNERSGKHMNSDRYFISSLRISQLRKGAWLPRSFYALNHQR